MFGFLKRLVGAADAPPQVPWGELPEAERQGLKDRMVAAYVRGDDVGAIAAATGRNLRLVISVLTAAGVYKNVQGWRAQNLARALRQSQAFDAQEMVLGVDGRALAISSQGVIALVGSDPEDLQFRRLAAADIVSFELIGDGRTLQTFERSTKIGSALIGGLLFGPAGAVVGALAARDPAAKPVELKTLGLRVLTQVPGEPSIELRVCEGQDTASEAHQDLKRGLQRFCDRLQVLLHQAASAPGPKAAPTRAPKARAPRTAAAPASAADEIRKLLDLKAQGVLTAEEFEQMKQALVRSAGVGVDGH